MAVQASEQVKGEDKRMLRGVGLQIQQPLEHLFLMGYQKEYNSRAQFLAGSAVARVKPQRPNILSVAFDVRHTVARADTANLR